MNIGDKIRVTVERRDNEWDRIIYPLGSVWIVDEIIDRDSGLVACKGNAFCIYAKNFEVVN